MTTEISRRALLALLAGSGVAALVGCSGDDGGGGEHAAGDGDGGGAEVEAPDEPCPPLQTALPGEAGGLAVIGARYAALYPDDDPAVVAADLPADAEAALAALSERVRADFEAGDVVDVDGWLLARTEARAAAVLMACG